MSLFREAIVLEEAISETPLISLPYGPYFVQKGVPAS